MKPKEILLNTLLKEKKITAEKLDVAENNSENSLTGIESPVKHDAFKMSNAEKIKKIEFHFEQIMETLGMDLNDDSLSGTPHRVAKMYVEEIFKGLNPANKPKIALFENKYKYDQMLVEKDIAFYSNCEHHFVPFFGKVQVAYFSSGKVIGLSKLNRIVKYYSKRPQVQERLTIQIAKEFQKILQTEDVAVFIEAKHLCVSSRGVQDHNSVTITTFYGGKFEKEKTKKEFLKYIGSKTKY